MAEENIEFEKVKIVLANSCFIIWRGKTYIGSIQDVAPEFSKEIILLSKTSYSLNEDVIDTMKIYVKKETLYADDILDLEGRQHFVRKVGNKITFMTKEQTEYMLANPPLVEEVNIL